MILFRESGVSGRFRSRKCFLKESRERGHCVKTLLHNRVLRVLVTFCFFMPIALHAEVFVPAQAQDTVTLSEASGVSTDAEGTIAAELLKANSDYLNGAFAEAAVGYNRVLGAGYPSFGLHFNLGNASYRLGDKASALAQYRLAESDRPRNPEVKGNIDLLLTEAGVSERSPRQGWFDYIPWSHWGGSDEFFLLFCICAGLPFTVFGLARLIPDFRMGARPDVPSFRLLGHVAAAGLFFVSLASALAFQASLERNRPGSRAVVRLNDTSARSESSEQSVVLFELPLLAEVRVLNSYPDSEAHLGQAAEWYQIRYDNSIQGWVPASALVVF